ncbi:hypothetical protein BS47DRAFT_1367467 [Hydnum rufescens UP504]|uniref:Uncharacterized protein n=1 Tax=Hydnum rufescens UP504 TaxID=1448309 RepID=A0A9P6AJ71_9AGAM|nr:hypothetical protein BS47DRAFT_1367467 [Hydnum rufescens UP504]
MPCSFIDVAAILLKELPSSSSLRHIQLLFLFWSFSLAFQGAWPHGDGAPFYCGFIYLTLGDHQLFPGHEKALFPTFHCKGPLVASVLSLELLSGAPRSSSPLFEDLKELQFLKMEPTVHGNFLYVAPHSFSFWISRSPFQPMNLPPIKSKNDKVKYHSRVVIYTYGVSHFLTGLIPSHSRLIKLKAPTTDPVLGVATHLLALLMEWSTDFMAPLSSPSSHGSMDLSPPLVRHNIFLAAGGKNNLLPLVDAPFEGKPADKACDDVSTVREGSLILLGYQASEERRQEKKQKWKEHEVADCGNMERPALVLMPVPDDGYVSPRFDLSNESDNDEALPPPLKRRKGPNLNSLSKHMMKNLIPTERFMITKYNYLKDERKQENHKTMGDEITAWVAMVESGLIIGNQKEGGRNMQEIRVWSEDVGQKKGVR